MEGTDTMPPLYYVLVSWMLRFFGDPHLGLRALSLIGFALALGLMYSYLERKVDGRTALVGAAFLMTTSLGPFAYEGRPYAVMIAALMGAIWAWEETAKKRWWAWILLCCLVLAMSMHYYAVFALPAFFAAEAMVMFQSPSHFRIWNWVAISGSLATLLIWMPYLAALKKVFGGGFWARSGVRQVFSTHVHHLHLATVAGLFIALGLTWFVVMQLRRGDKATFQFDAARIKKFKREDYVLCAGLLWVSVVGVTATFLTGGGMTTRYLLPEVLAGSIGVAMVSTYLSRNLQAVLVGLLFLIFGISHNSEFVAVLQKPLAEQRLEMATHVEPKLLQAAGFTLPVVLEDGIQFFPVSYYASGDVAGRLHYLLDKQAAIRLVKSDTVDVALEIMARRMPIKVEAYDRFIRRHREFFMMSPDGTLFAWLGRRLVEEGFVLKLVAQEGGQRLFHVQAPDVGR